MLQALPARNGSANEWTASYRKTPKSWFADRPLYKRSGRVSRYGRARSMPVTRPGAEAIFNSRAGRGQRTCGKRRPAFAGRKASPGSRLGKCIRRRRGYRSFGNGSFTLSPLGTVSHTPLPHFGQDAKCVFEFI